MKTEVLSKRKKQILEYIHNYSTEHAFPPTVREMCAALGLASTSTIQTHVNEMIMEGYLSRVEYSPRTLRLTELGLQAISGSEEIIDKA